LKFAGWWAEFEDSSSLVIDPRSTGKSVIVLVFPQLANSKRHVQIKNHLLHKKGLKLMNCILSFVTFVIEKTADEGGSSRQL
jgi:hypothetical protein